MVDKEEYLQIEELKKRFKDYNKISVNDFNEFYNDVFGNVKRDTVSWHIYELKKKGIIRNVSRGQYVLEDNNVNEKKEYVVVTMDIVNSTRFEYQEFNKKLEKKILELNYKLEETYGYDRMYKISQGDEIQILLPFTKDIGNIIILTLSILYPFRTRYGISIGDVEGDIKDNSWEMNGPIFWNARDQLEKLKKAINYEGLIISGYANTDQLCNNIFPLINSCLDKITEKQWEVIPYELSKQNIEKTIEHIGISRTSYYDRISASNIYNVLSSFDTIYELMKIRRAIK